MTVSAAGLLNGNGNGVRIGVLGGTFDPIHNGHIVIAEEVRVKLDLSVVLFMPAGEPWMKANTPISAAEHRVAMVRLAIEGKPHFKLSTMEIERPGPTYTIDTVTELKSQIGAKDEIFFILGQDNIPQLPKWKEPARLIKLCYLVAVPRPGTRPPDLKSLEGTAAGISERVILLDKPLVDVGASDIRTCVARGQSISHLVPEAVDRYIQEHGLYKNASQT